MEKQQYYFSKIVDNDFDSVIEKVTEEAAKEGFGILTDIDMRAAFKKRLDVDFRPYRILGACHPPSAYKAVNVEDKIGTMLPCNFIVQQLEDGKVEVAGVDPVQSMMAIENDALRSIAIEVREMIQKVVASI